MYGETEFLGSDAWQSQGHAAWLWIFVAANVSVLISDIAYRKIFNIQNLLILVLGLVWAALYGKFQSAGLGVLAALCIGIVPYSVRMISGGDVKYLMALGAWLGASGVVDISYYSLVFGGLLGVLVLVWNERAVDFFRRVLHFLWLLASGAKPSIAGTVRADLQMPFGVAISGAAIFLSLWGGP